MSEHARRRLFALVSLLVALGGEDKEAPRRASGAVRTGLPAPPVRPVRSHSPPAPSPRATDDLASAGPGSNPERARRRERLRSPAFLRREKPRVLAAAQRFLRAFYAYDAGSREPQTIASMRAGSTAALARRLLAPSARCSGSPTAGDDGTRRLPQRAYLRYPQSSISLRRPRSVA